jgi:hypothetical protein
VTLEETMLKYAFIALLVIHALIHLMGAAKAFGWADVEAIHQPITKLAGAAWLIAMALFLASASLLAIGASIWWLPSAVALVVSQLAIMSAWHDARFGIIANVIILVPVALAIFDLRPASLRSQYESRAAEAIAHAIPSDGDVVTAEDLRALPAPLRRYLENTDIVGKPRVRNVRIRWNGEIRNGAEASWMPFTATQVSTFGEDATRLFFIESSLHGIPFVGLHAYEGEHATMDVRVAGVVKVVDAKGREMDEGETVTMFNDLCVFAPAALLDAHVKWEELDAHRVRGTLTNAGHTVSAVLFFNERGDLVDFISEDRFQTTDGKTYHRYPWSTPLGEYAIFDGARIAASGEAKWLTPNGELLYGRLNIEHLDYNVRAP